ncbi:7616_t:CDS:2 [Acaulospora colombiana]|uniref:7616_t:CDS:1 n=1 Tax=Acaulospora colombiana TaxID=27376 RepID=A0ACA9JXA2_9GLOM|nr:7616_t:CDS:2 [Acaulospora colombiana]
MDRNIYSAYSQREGYLRKFFNDDSSLSESEKSFLIDKARSYLDIARENFKNWTSGNIKIDELIQECQQKVISPKYIIEWIDYGQFQDIKHKAEGGCATIYSARWKDGPYSRWDSDNQLLKKIRRTGHSKKIQ